MTRPVIIAVGHVVSAKVITAAGRKPYLAVRIELPPEQYNGNSYSAKMEARVRWKFEELNLQPGDLVSVRGDAKAEAYEFMDKQLGSLIAECASISVIGARDEAGGEPELPVFQPEPATAPSNRSKFFKKKPVEPLNYSTPGDDDVNF